MQEVPLELARCKHFHELIQVTCSTKGWSPSDLVRRYNEAAPEHLHVGRSTAWCWYIGRFVPADRHRKVLFDQVLGWSPAVQLLAQDLIATAAMGD